MSWDEFKKGSALPVPAELEDIVMQLLEKDPQYRIQSAQELARIAGCSREMAGRVLKKLEAEGKLHARGKTVVVYGTRRAMAGHGGAKPGGSPISMPAAHRCCPI